MKVGVLTIHGGQNFGAYLQAETLVEFIGSLGHEVDLIPFRSLEQETRERQLQRGNLRSWLQSLRDSRKLRAWESYYRDLLAAKVVTDEQAIQWSDYDAVVVGSDVVWHYESPYMGGTKPYFGILPGEGPQKWISYAASCAWSDPEALPIELGQGIQQFDAISVRDEYTAELVKQGASRDSTMVLDPTWLPKAENWVSPEESEPILAVYNYARIEPSKVKVIRDYAKQENLKIVALGYRKSWADENLTTLMPHEWVEKLRTARCVVTGTFHGTLYSLRLGRPFVVIGNKNILRKAKAPLELTGTLSQLVSTPEELKERLEALSSQSWNLPYQATQDLRDQSWNFLRQHLPSV